MATIKARLARPKQDSYEFRFFEFDVFGYADPNDFKSDVVWYYINDNGLVQNINDLKPPSNHHRLIVAPCITEPIYLVVCAKCKGLHKPDMACSWCRC